MSDARASRLGERESSPDTRSPSRRGGQDFSPLAYKNFVFRAGATKSYYHHDDDRSQSEAQVTATGADRKCVTGEASSAASKLSIHETKTPKVAAIPLRPLVQPSQSSPTVLVTDELSPTVETQRPVEKKDRSRKATNCPTKTPSTPPAKLLSVEQLGHASGPSVRTLRSPSLSTPRPESERNLRTSETFRSPKYENSTVLEIQKRVLNLMKEPLVFKKNICERKEGRIYVIHDPEIGKYGFVKVGRTTQSMKGYATHIRWKCKAEEAVMYHPEDLTPVYALMRLENLVHRDLSPHNWTFECLCKQRRKPKHRGRAKDNQESKDVVKLVRHEEWFNVTKEVALETSRIWWEFIQQHPYGDPAEMEAGQSYPLQTRWADRLLRAPLAEKTETHEDHDIRHKRWRSLLKLASEEGDASCDVYVKLEPVEDEATPLQEDEDAPQNFEDGATDTPETVESLADLTSDADDTEDNDGCEDETSAMKREAETDEVEQQSGPEAGSPRPPESIPATQPAKTPSVKKTVRLCVADDDEGHKLAQVFDKSSRPPDSLPATRPARASGVQKTVSDENNEKGHKLDDIAADSSRPPDSLPATQPAKAPSVEETVRLRVERIDRGLKLDDAIKRLQAFMKKPRPAVPSRSIYDDLVRLRWTLACLAVFALHAPYVPPGLSFGMWVFFLPLLVAELRGWF